MNDNRYSGYTPIIEAVSQGLGAQVQLWNTGGGCMALGATLEGKVELLITDAEDTLSSWAERQEWLVDRGCKLGYMVGVYYDVDNGNDPVCYVRGRNTVSAAGVLSLVQRALTEAAAKEFKPSPVYVDPVDLPEIV